MNKTVGVFQIMFEVDPAFFRQAAEKAEDHRVRQLLLEMAAELDRRSATDARTARTKSG
jgi:hypothetical protein